MGRRVPLPLAGLLSLAVAMGIGRFAFTPMLPMMQADLGLSLSQGGWLASSNYLGYLLGALLGTRLSWSSEKMLEWGLWAVVLVTAAMGLGTLWPGWVLWRFLAGVASAWALIGTSALCVARLAASGRGEKTGVVFAGVGFGIAFAGLACMALTLLDVRSSHAWLWLALASLAGLLGASMLWQVPPADDSPVRKASTEAVAPPPPVRPAADSGRLHWGLVWCYGFFGFGYILPATFLPAQARLLVPDAWLFSLAWPVFGLAAAASTLLGSHLTRYCRRPTIWAAAQLIMGVGVLLPALWQSLAAILIAALCVGSTFMVITMVGLQEAQVQVGATAIKRQIAAMVASFAFGQLAGPVFFNLSHAWFGAPLSMTLIAGTAVLVLGSVPVLRLKARA